MGLRVTRGVVDNAAEKLDQMNVVICFRMVYTVPYPPEQSPVRPLLDVLMVRLFLRRRAGSSYLFLVAIPLEC